MRRSILLFIALAFVLASCGSDDAGTSNAAGTCLAGDPNCDDVGGDDVAPPLPDAIDLSDPEGPITIISGGFFFSDGETARLCGALAESFPPQCAETIIEILGPLDVVLEHVAESFGNPDDADIKEEQGIRWTDEWVNISGLLENGSLVIDS